MELLYTSNITSYKWPLTTVARPVFTVCASLYAQRRCYHYGNFIIRIHGNPRAPWADRSM